MRELIADRAAGYRTGRYQHDIIESAKIAVVGAGALGNEVLKNLALLGVGELHLFDFDVIEPGNLSRTLLYRSTDAEKKASKALVAAERLRELAVNARAHIVGHHCDVVWDLGGGFLRRFDCVLGCVDNLEARLAIGRLCYQFRVPYIDGGIRDLDGRVQVHKTGHGACFDCTIGDDERDDINRRYSCLAVRRTDFVPPSIATVLVTSATIAALMCKEALNVLHGSEERFGSTLTWFGGDSATDWLRLQQRSDCLTCSVPPREAIQTIPVGRRHSGHALVEQIPSGWSIQLPSPFIRTIACRCGRVTEIQKPSHRCTANDLVCGLDGSGEVRLDRVERLDANSPADVLERCLADLGIPAQAALFGGAAGESALFLLNGSD